MSEFSAEISSPSEIFQALVDWAEDRVADANRLAIQRYLRQYSQVELNWKRKGKKLPTPKPENAIVLEVAGQAVRWYESDEPVMPKLPDPWDVAPKEKAPGVVSFGVELDTGIYAAGKTNSVPKGTKYSRDGTEYTFIQNAPGRVNSIALWVAEDKLSRFPLEWRTLEE